MTGNAILQILVYLLVLFVLAKPLGTYIAKVYLGKSCCGLEKALGPVERLIYKVCAINPKQEMNWKSYLWAVLLFNFLEIIVIYLLQRCQAYLPLNPSHLANIDPNLAFNTAISFVTNTNWQAYSGESSMSYFTQMLGFGVQNFISAATGMAVLIALIRGLTRAETSSLGNFWSDLVRGILYILLPLSVIWATVLMSQGVIQNFKASVSAHLVQPITYVETVKNPSGQLVNQATSVTEVSIPQGPVASQVAIKQLGSNGGGYFNANSAHPYENPTPISNFFEMLALLLIPAALCHTFGSMVGDKKQGWAVFAAMAIIFIPALFLTVSAEQAGSPAMSSMHISHNAVANAYPGGNMEGKETRFGITDSAIWATATTASSNGSTNAAMDSMTPIGGLIPMWLMQLGEVVFGGVGSGLYGMLMMVVITVFVAGLMVGRTPEYLGKKIEPFEMKMASSVLLIMPCIVLISTAIAVMTKMGTSVIGNFGPHGFSEILYAFTSMANNNGSAFGGLNADSTLYTLLGGIVMLIGRYWIIIPVLAMAGSLAAKKITPPSPGTLPTHTPFFVGLLIVVIIMVGALTFLPSLALGPIVEQLMIG